MLKFVQKFLANEKNSPSDFSVPVVTSEIATDASIIVAGPIYNAETSRAYWREVFAGHCKRCGHYLKSDGSCDLCRRPLPF